MRRWARSTTAATSSSTRRTTGHRRRGDREQVRTRGSWRWRGGHELGDGGSEPPAEAVAHDRAAHVPTDRVGHPRRLVGRRAGRCDGQRPDRDPDPAAPELDKGGAITDPPGHAESRARPFDAGGRMMARPARVDIRWRKPWRLPACARWVDRCASLVASPATRPPRAPRTDLGDGHRVAASRSAARLAPRAPTTGRSAHDACRYGRARAARWATTADRLPSRDKPLPSVPRAGDRWCYGRPPAAGHARFRPRGGRPAIRSSEGSVMHGPAPSGLTVFHRCGRSCGRQDDRGRNGWWETLSSCGSPARSPCGRRSPTPSGARRSRTSSRCDSTVDTLVLAVPSVW